MDSQSQDLEHLISKHLDGLLDEDERLTLDRELLRNPDARPLMEACANADTLAAGALQEAFPDRTSTIDPRSWIEGVSRHPVASQAHRWWWLVPGSIAAGLLAMLANSATMTRPSSPQRDRVAATHTAQPIVGRVAPVSAQSPQPVMRHVSMAPRRKIQRDTSHNAYGVMGREGVLYWIEVDRTRTIKRPNPKAGYYPVLDEM